MFIKGSIAVVKQNELSTDSNKPRYPFVQVPAGSKVTVLSGPSPYVYLTKGKGEMFYKVDYAGQNVAIAANNLKSVRDFRVAKVPKGYQPPCTCRNFQGDHDEECYWGTMWNEAAEDDDEIRCEKCWRPERICHCGDDPRLSRER